MIDVQLPFIHSVWVLQQTKKLQLCFQRGIVKGKTEKGLFWQKGETPISVYDYTSPNDEENIQETY